MTSTKLITPRLVLRTWRAYDIEPLAAMSADVGVMRFIGFAGIVVPRWEAKLTPCLEIMWRFVPSAWGNGFATEAARAALDDGFAHHDFPEVLSFTVQENERSWRVMERSRHIVYRICREAWNP